MVEWNQKQQQDFQKAWVKCIAKAWQDAAFKKKLLSDPVAALKENGVQFPPEVTCKINENTGNTFYLTLPQKPTGEVSEESLKQMAAGAGTVTGVSTGNTFK